VSLRPLRLLILEDNAQDAELAVGYLTAAGFAPFAKVVETETDFRAALAESFDLIITDYTLPAFDGLNAIRMVRAAPGVQPPVIVVTGTASEDEAVECMREGADDYVLKDRPARFGQAVRQALERRTLKQHAEHAQEGLRASEQQLRMAQRIARMGSWEYQFADRSLTVSDGFREVFDLPDTATAVDLGGFIARIHPDDRARVRASIEQSSSGPQEPETEYRIVRRDGSERTILTAGEVVHEAGALIGIRGTTQDITDRRQVAQHLHRSEQLFEQGFENAPVGMGLIDPQRRTFTRVNDAMCAIHSQTRAALQSAGWLSRATYPEDIAADDAVYARLVAGTLKSDERQKRVRRADGSVGWISRSLSALRDPDGTVSSVFCQVIDITEQKQREEELKAQVSDVAWIARIRDALDHDHFVLYSQPIVDLRTGDTVQQELLLRMRNSDGSIIAPGDFLPVAERYGLISEIDRWVIVEAVGLAARGQPTQFNLSAASIGDPEVLHELACAIERTEADPSLLVVEVTETAIITQLETGRRFAQQVTALGCRLALDDFGTGYSSLTHLKQIPAHHLKIDIEFVRDLTRSETDERLVRGIIGLAREFDQTTIAEGIEDRATLVRLRELGVDFGQGYLLGHPQPLATAAATTAVEPRSDPLG
jgi:PAS domain S-box-containing protein